MRLRSLTINLAERQIISEFSHFVRRGALADALVLQRRAGSVEQGCYCYPSLLFSYPESAAKRQHEPKLHLSELTNTFISSSPMSHAPLCSSHNSSLAFCSASPDSLPSSWLLTASITVFVSSTCRPGSRPNFGSKANGAWYRIWDSMVNLKTSLTGSR